MATQTDEDHFAVRIQLNTEDAGRGFHRRNDGNEIQRPDVVDDCCQDLLLQARIDRIIHGYEKDGSVPASLIVFGFRFHGIDDQRRFKRATISVTFQDEKKRRGRDPEVIALWPNGDFTLGEPTETAVEATKGGEAGVNLTAGTIVQGGGHITRTWERKISHKKTDRSALTGSIILNEEIRDFGPNNAVRLTLSENKVSSSGLVNDLRMAVLLRRQNDTDSFSGVINMQAKAHFSYNAISGVRNILGLSPTNDPVMFKPGVQYLRPPTLGTLLEGRLADTVDLKNLNSDMLDDLSGVLGSTVLTL